MKIKGLLIRKITLSILLRSKSNNKIKERLIQVFYLLKSKWTEIISKADITCKTIIYKKNKQINTETYNWFANRKIRK